MKKLWAIVVSASFLAAGASVAEGATTSRASTCLDRCASKRPTAADQKKYSDCLRSHFQTMKTKVAALKRKSREARDAAWKEIHQAREASAIRCLPATLKAWNDCLKTCSGR